MKPSPDERGRRLLPFKEADTRIYVSSELRISRNVPGLNWLSRRWPPRSPPSLASEHSAFPPNKTSSLFSSSLLSSPLFPFSPRMAPSEPASGSDTARRANQLSFPSGYFIVSSRFVVSKSARQPVRQTAQALS